MYNPLYYSECFHWLLQNICIINCDHNWWSDTADMNVILWHEYGEKKLSVSFFPFLFLGLHLMDMEIPSLGVKSELQLLAYTTGIAVPDPNHIFNLLCSLQQCRTHWARPGMEPESSWILVGFLTCWDNVNSKTKIYFETIHSSVM